VSGVLPLALGLSFELRITEALEALDGVSRGLADGEDPTRLVLQSTAVTLGLLDATTAPAVADRTRSLLLAAKDDAAPRPVLAVAASVAARANAPAADAAELARRAVGAGARPLPEPGEPTWLLHAVLALLLVERFDEAQALCDAAVTEARATANRLILAPTLALRSWLMLRRGDLTGAEADARPLLEEEPMLSLLHRSLASTVLVATQIERGRLDDAARTLASVAVNPHGSTHATAWLRHARGRLRLAQRRFGEALADLLAAGEIITRTGAVSPSYLPWRSGAALAHIALGRPEEARRLSDEEVRLARAFGAPRAIGTALRTAGLVAANDAAEPLLREAAEVLDGSGLDLERARVLTDLGALLRRSNRRGEARELLRVAMDAAHRAGAALLADRAEAELRATGARPRRATLTGLEALTASERRIAELAAQGLMNREIAQNLFVTARTVEGHLTNVFSKLGITARTELPQALARTTTPTALT
jgi:ATP/maltotriose-dependent transcriptional regulator MalT